MVRKSFTKKESYELVWKDHGDFPGMIEGCVRYEDESGNLGIHL